MKFAAVALMGAVVFTDLIEGRRTSEYKVTRAICDAEAYEAPYEGRRLRRDESLTGLVQLSQIVDENGGSEIRVWSHFRNVEESDSYELCLLDAQDCGGSQDASIDS